jgi:hypothetical protein
VKRTEHGPTAGGSGELLAPLPGAGPGLLDLARAVCPPSNVASAARPLASPRAESCRLHAESAELAGDPVICHAGGLLCSRPRDHRGRSPTPGG